MISLAGNEGLLVEHAFLDALFDIALDDADPELDALFFNGGATNDLAEDHGHYGDQFHGPEIVLVGDLLEVFNELELIG